MKQLTSEMIKELAAKGELEGFYRVHFDDYLSGGGWSRSAIRTLLSKSPKHLKYYTENPEHKETAAMATGTALHCAVLEPDLFKQNYIWTKQFDDMEESLREKYKKPKTTKIYKDALDEFLAEHPGKIYLDTGEYTKICTMRDSVMFKYGDLFEKGGVAEATYYWYDNDTGVLCKARADFLSSDYGIIDLKTAADGSPAFYSSVKKYGYDIQDVFYSMGVESLVNKEVKLKFLVVENSPPYDCCMYTVPEIDRHFCFDKIKQALTTIAECLSKDVWPGYPKEERELGSE